MVQFQFLVTFLAVFFLVCNLYKSGLYLTIYFGHRKCFILVFRFLVFSGYKHLNSNHYLLLLAVLPELEMMQFRSGNYVYQSVNYTSHFRHVWNFGKYLYLTVFSKQWKCLILGFCWIQVVAIVLATVFSQLKGVLVILNPKF